MPVSKKRPAAKGKAKAASKPATIRQATVDSTEDAAHVFVKEALDLAFKGDGLRGALSVAHAIAMAYDEFACAAEQDAQFKDEKLLRGVAAAHVLTNVVPAVVKSLEELEAQGA